METNNSTVKNFEIVLIVLFSFGISWEKEKRRLLITITDKSFEFFLYIARNIRYFDNFTLKIYDYPILVDWIGLMIYRNGGTSKW